jgi:hypothetical protein
VYISSNHFNNPIQWNHGSLLPSSPISKSQPPPFCKWFSSKNGCYFKLGGFYFCFGMFIMSFILQSFKYGVWGFTRLFCPRWFFEWLPIFFNVCGHIVHGHVPPFVSHLLVTSQLLVLQKQMENIRPIMIGEVIYWLVAFTLTIQFRDKFVKHFNHH